MKYGYMFYQKPLRSEKKDRPMNLGDPIQALAAINLFHEMGIPDEDIVPVPRFDTADYDGEEVILSVNCSENYEHLCYNTSFLPFSKKINPIITALHFHRKIDKDEIDCLKKHGPVGCRDESTLLFMRELGVKAFLSGCLTITFPRRIETERQEKVFLVDCPTSLLTIMPQKIRENAISLTQIIRCNSKSENNRITKEETEDYHRMAYEQMYRLRDEAKLVVTSKLHVATPCLAMGIPVILAKENNFDVRFGFLDKFLPLYTRERYHGIDWNPLPQDIEREKALIKECFFSSVRAAAAQTQVSAMYESRNRQLMHSYGMKEALKRVPLSKEKPFRYVIWGACLHATFLLMEEMEESFPNATLVNLVDTYASGRILDFDVIHPDQIASLEKDVTVFVTAPSAHISAKKLLGSANRPFVLIKSINTKAYGFSLP